MLKKLLVAIAAFVVMLGALSAAPANAATSGSIKLPTYPKLENDVWYSMGSTGITGFDASGGLRLTVAITDGELRMGDWPEGAVNTSVPDGYLGNSGDSGPLMAWDAVAPTSALAELRAILKVVDWKANDIHAAELTVQIAPAGYMINAANGHFYKAVNLYDLGLGCDWNVGYDYASAAERRFHGLDGYLATITSQSENDFVGRYIGVDSWIGASDHVDAVNAVTANLYADQAAVEGKFYWVAGPEAGTQITTGNDAALNSIEGVYNNFNREDGEPNNWADDESFVEFYAWSQTWNDMPDSVCGALIEWGGLGTWEGGEIMGSKSAIVDTLVNGCDIGKLVGKIRFQPDSAKLNATYRKRLAAIGAAILKSGCAEVTVKGFTATTADRYLPGQKLRLQLSAARARYLKDYLTAYFKAKGVAVRVYVRRYGAAVPIKSNDTAAGRKANRRVEVVLGAPQS